MTRVKDDDQPSRYDCVVSRGRSPRRIRREWRTVVEMVEMYCRAHHGSVVPCGGCADLLSAARRRLDRCPYGIDKPTCVNCSIHCYRADERSRMREIMRWAGPRMLRRHPLLAVLHLIDGRRTAPEARRASAGSDTAAESRGS